MNYLKTTLIAFAAALLGISCGKDDGPNEPDIPNDSAYTGTFTVAPGTADAFVLEDAAIEFTLAEGGASAEMKMLHVRFAERMPAMDITVPGMTLTPTAGGYAISGNGIIPLALGGEVARYTITGLTGSVTAETLTFSMMCGTYPLSFSGTYTEE